jgi:hypothetical protein
VNCRNALKYKTAAVVTDKARTNEAAKKELSAAAESFERSEDERDFLGRSHWYVIEALHEAYSPESGALTKA